jgi:hypothetical protein
MLTKTAALEAYNLGSQAAYDEYAQIKIAAGTEPGTVRKIVEALKTVPGAVARGARRAGSAISGAIPNSIAGPAALSGAGGAGVGALGGLAMGDDLNDVLAGAGIGAAGGLGAYGGGLATRGLLTKLIQTGKLDNLMMEHPRLTAGGLYGTLGLGAAGTGLGAGLGANALLND